MRFAVEELARHLFPVRGEGGGAGATELGQQAHRELASILPRDAETEVAVDAEWTDGGSPIRIVGRVDGVARSLFGPVVFELKTYGRPPRDFDELEARFPHHVFQLRLYGFMFEAAGEVPELRLLSVGLTPDGRPDLAGGSEIAVPRVDIGDDLDLAVRSLVRHRRRAQARRQKRKGLEPGAPFERWRELQVEILDFLDEHPRGVVVAATGSGKTAPTLEFVCRRALARGGSVFWATAKTSGQQPVMDTIRRLRERGPAVRALRLSAQDRLCAHHGPCPEILRHRRQVYGRDLWKRALQEGLVEAGALIELAGAEGVCPRALQDELIDLVDVVVGDYNFVLDPRPAARNLLGGALVIDEAHNVYDRVREALSVDIRTDQAEAALGGRIEVRQLARDFLAAQLELPVRALPSEYQSLLPLSGRARALFAASEPDEPGLDFLGELGAIEWAISEDENPRLGMSDREGVRFLCLDPAPFLKARLTDVDPLVLLSATLDPPDVHLHRIGLEDLPARVLEGSVRRTTPGPDGPGLGEPVSRAGSGRRPRRLGP